MGGPIRGIARWWKEHQYNWEHYALGLHNLQLIVTATDNPSPEICRGNMTVTVYLFRR